MPQLHEVVALDGKSRGKKVRRRALDLKEGFTRRQLLKGTAVGVGTLLSLRVSGLITPGIASASHEGTDGYRVQFYPDGCRGANLHDFYYEGPEVYGTASKPCGPSANVEEACVTSGHKVGWHKNGETFSGGRWELRKGACNNNIDAWKWQVPGGGLCSNMAEFRCHDGYKRYNDGRAPLKTICGKIVRCA